MDGLRVVAGSTVCSESTCSTILLMPRSASFTHRERRGRRKAWSTAISPDFYIHWYWARCWGSEEIR